MTRIITGTASVDPGGSIVTAWSNTDGVTLSEITAPADSTVVIEGRSNFIKKRLSTTSFELMLPHAGDGGAGLDCAISALTAGEAQIGTLNARTATVIQQLGVLDANGRGLFYNLIGATGDNDPGPGRMAFNNADPELVTELYLDVLDANEGGRDVSGLIGLWSAGAVLVVRSIASTAYAAFQLNAAPGTPAGYRKVTCSFVGGDGTLATEPVAIEWRLPGADKDVDATVTTLAGRAIHDNAPAEFRVLVENEGGIAYRYVKLSAAAADWSAGARITGASITLDVTEVDEVPYGVPPDVTLTPRPGGYDVSFVIPRGMIIEPGATTTLASDQPAAVSFVPVTGGYRVDFAIPRGAAGDIEGVTPFWVTRLSSDTDAAAARVGLGAVGAPAVATNNRVALFDGGASLLKDSGFAIQGNALDTSPNALLRFGAFGVGAVQNLLSPDLSAVRPAGRYYCNAPTNGPGGNGWLDVYDLSADYALYEYFTVPGGVPYRNFRDNGVWKGWTRTSLEVGSNANGRYVRDYSTRVQWCFGRVGPRSVTIATTGTTVGVYFSPAQTHTYPAAFASAPEIAIFNARGNLTWIAASGSDPGLTSCGYYIMSPSTEPARICTESIISQGLF